MPADTTKFRRPIRVFSKPSLLSAWRASRDSKKNAGARGVDNISARQFYSHLDRHISRVVGELHRGEYRFSSLRPVFVPKKSGPDERVICVPTVSDRLVQRVIVEHLSGNDRLRLLNDVSFGFVRGGKLKDALDEALRRRSKHEWVLKTDIHAFFDRIDRDLLKKQIRKTLRNQSVVPLLWAVIDCEIKARKPTDRRKLQESGIKQGRGLRQGMPLSPLLSNFILANFDRAAVRGGHNLIRYADDLIVFGSSREDLNRSYAFLVSELAKVRHKVPEPGEGSKTVFIHPRDPVEFLGMDIVFKEKVGRYVCRVPLAVKKKITASIKEENALDAVLKERETFYSLHSRLSSLPSSYRNVFHYAENWPAVDVEIRRACNTALAQAFKDIFGDAAIRALTPELKRFLNIEALAED